MVTLIQVFSLLHNVVTVVILLLWSLLVSFVDNKNTSFFSFCLLFWIFSIFRRKFFFCFLSKIIHQIHASRCHVVRSYLPVLRKPPYIPNKCIQTTNFWSFVYIGFLLAWVAVRHKQSNNDNDRVVYVVWLLVHSFGWLVGCCIVWFWISCFPPSLLKVLFVLIGDVTTAHTTFGCYSAWVNCG